MKTRSNSQRWIRIFALVSLLVCGLAGCRTKTVLVPDGTPVRIREETRCKVWVLAPNDRWVEGEVILPIGWYALPDPGPEEVAP